jgi:hypothetical protein
MGENTDCSDSTLHNRRIIQAPSFFAICAAAGIAWFSFFYFYEDSRDIILT